MTYKIFIDTNILVYTVDNSNPEKKKTAKKLLAEIINRHMGVLSTQVMQEYYVVATRKLQIDPVISKALLTHLKNFEIVSLSPQIIFNAIDCSILNRLSFWDALIVSAAASANCTEIWTEDLNHDQVIQGVRIKNPFM
jgi:predicted nucleic acid-binding protein